jgi:hypothetical protein
LVATGIVRLGKIFGLGDRQAAMADIEIDRRIDLRIVKFQQHVIAGNTEMRRTERDEGRDVEAAHADDFELRIVSAKAQSPRILVGELGLRLDAGPFQDGQHFLEDTPLRQRQNKHVAHQRPLAPAFAWS